MMFPLDAHPHPLAPPMKVAFLGLGAIGRHMAARLALAGHDLAVWNRTAARAASFGVEHKGVTVARTPAEAARGREIVITCVSTSRDVESMLDGPDGLEAGLAAGALLVDCTSGDPGISRRIAARLADRRVGFIDAPVSGGVAGAEKGTLTVMCGGDPNAIERARPALEAFANKIVRCGGIGAGHAVKAVNQYLLAAHIWSLAEGLALLERSGVASDVALDIINTSSGRSNVSQNLFPERVLTRAFPRTFKLALLDKDVAIAESAAREGDMAAPMLALTARLMKEAHAELGEEADHVEAVRVVESRAGVEIAGLPKR